MADSYISESLIGVWEYPDLEPDGRDKIVHLVRGVAAPRGERHRHGDATFIEGLERGPVGWQRSQELLVRSGVYLSQLHDSYPSHEPGCKRNLEGTVSASGEEQLRALFPDDRRSSLYLRRSVPLCKSDRVGAPHDFDAIYREAGARLWRSLYAYTAGRGDIAQDAMAEAFARAMERSASIRDPIPYLYRTAFRIASSELRRPATDETLPDVPATEPVDTTDLLSAFRHLTPGQRASVYLHYQADLPVREVARLMGTSSAVVKVHLSQGRRRLRSLLADDLEDRADV